MESLESCVEKLDMRSMPQFLDQVSDARETEESRHFAISLYAELARVHKQAVIPFIPRMMASIVRSLPFSADSQHLHEACAKVVASVARYTIDPTRPYESNQNILCNLCSPLLPVLSSKLESASVGAATCLQALVESEKWKFAPSDLQEVICTKATAALVEQSTQSVAFFHLIKSLAKFSVEASKEHVAEWLGEGLKILQTDIALWQKRLAAAQLITILLKTEDVNKLGLDLPSIMKILEVCMLDKITVVQTAVSDAFETAKGVGLHKHLLENTAPGERGLIDLSCESQRRFSDMEELGMQDLSGSVSPRSGASSQEAVPSMTPSRMKLGRELKRSKQQVQHASCLPHLNGSLKRASMLKEKTPATIPRRVLSVIPASSKRSSNLDFLPVSQEAISLRRSSTDLESKAARYNYSDQNQAMLGSRKFGQFVSVPMNDSVQRTTSLVKKHVDGCQNSSNIDCRSTADLEKKENAPLESLTGGHTDISSKEDDEEFNEGGKKSSKISSEGSLQKRCLQSVSVTSESDGDVGCANCGFLPKDISMEAKSTNLSLKVERSQLKVNNSQNSSQNFNFRAPCNLLHSIQGKGSAEDMKQSCKECSESEIKAPSGGCWTTSDSLISDNSEGDQSVSGNFQSKNTTSVVNRCSSKMSDACGSKKYKLRSRMNQCSLTSESAGRLSSENSASGQECQPSSRESSDREVNYNAKAVHRHDHSKASGSELPTTSTGPVDVKLREMQHSSNRATGVWIFKGQICAGAALGLFFAVGLLLLALVVMQHVNQFYGLHVLVPT